MSWFGDDLQFAELQCPGLFACGSAGLAPEAELGLGLRRDGMFRGPGSTVEFDGDRPVLQHDVDRMPVAVDEGDLFADEIQVLAFLRVGDDAERIAAHDEIEDVATLAGTVDGETGEGSLTFEPELEADVGLRESEAALLDRPVAAFAGLEGA